MHNMACVELPNEIWLEVLLQLDYRTLKTCERVSKSFKEFVQNAAFDQKLFRARAVVNTGGGIALDNLTLHPVFERVSFECATEIEDAYLFGPKDDDTFPLTEVCAAPEHATDPPLSLICLQIHLLESLQSQ